jgi:hypothetical protein
MLILRRKRQSSVIGTIVGVGDKGSGNVQDKLLWCWLSDNIYSIASTYWSLFAGSSRPLGAKMLWKVWAPTKVKHFFWLALHKLCWTASRRKRHGLEDSIQLLCSLWLGCRGDISHFADLCLQSVGLVLGARFSWLWEPGAAVSKLFMGMVAFLKEGGAQGI